MHLSRYKLPLYVSDLDLDDCRKFETEGETQRLGTAGPQATHGSYPSESFHNGSHSSFGSEIMQLNRQPHGQIRFDLMHAVCCVGKITFVWLASIGLDVKRSDWPDDVAYFGLCTGILLALRMLPLVEQSIIDVGSPLPFSVNCRLVSGQELGTPYLFVTLYISLAPVLIVLATQLQQSAYRTSSNLSVTMVYATNIQSKFSHKIAEPVPEFKTDHPAHPALVHFPIAFNLLAWSLDILYALTTTYVRPSFLTSRFDSDSTLLDITRLSYFLLCAGLITTIPAIMSGNKQLLGLIGKNGGPWEKDERGKQKSTMVPRIKMAITHAIVMDVVFFANLYSWYIRRSTEARPNPGTVPSGLNMLISVCLIPPFMGAAKAGASLVFNHGVGLNLGKKVTEPVYEKEQFSVRVD